MVTVRHLTKRYQLLLLPITVFIGAEQAFVNVEFTAAFVACGWGISKIGYVMICFGVVNALGSAFAGALTKLVGQFWVLVGNALVHVSLIVWMINWRAVPGDAPTLCVMAALWGLVDGVWLVQINGEFFFCRRSGRSWFRSPHLTTTRGEEKSRQSMFGSGSEWKKVRRTECPLEYSRRRRDACES